GRRHEWIALLVDERDAVDRGQRAERGGQLVGKLLTRASALRGAVVRRLDRHESGVVRTDRHRTGEGDGRRGEGGRPGCRGRVRQASPQCVYQILGGGRVGGLRTLIVGYRDHTRRRFVVAGVIEVVRGVVRAESLLGQQYPELLVRHVVDPVASVRVGG